MLAPLVQSDLALLVSSKVLSRFGGSRFHFLYHEFTSDVILVDKSITNFVGCDTFVVMLLQCLEMQNIIFVAFPLTCKLFLEAGLASNI